MKPGFPRAATRFASRVTAFGRTSALLVALAGATCFSAAEAQEIRYSWVDMSYMFQDVGRAGSLTPLPGQTVDISTSDGTGVRFRGSLDTWKNFYLMIDYGSTDIDLAGTVTNDNTGFVQEFGDEFDFTAIRGGIGFRFSILDATDIFGELTYDSLDFDFGSFAGENFDMSRQDFGAAAGVRTMFGRTFQAELRARYSDIGDTDLTTGFLEPDVLFGAGFAWEVIRGLSIVGDFESGELSSWSLGFRIDLDED